MSSEELEVSMRAVSSLIHKIYQESNEGPRLLNELFREYPAERQLRHAVTNRHGASGELTGIPATATI